MNRSLLSVIIACVALPAAAQPAPFPRDAVERPLLLPAGLVEVALEGRALTSRQDIYFNRENVYDVAPRARVGLVDGWEAELAARSGLCVGEATACGSRAQDLGAVARRQILSTSRFEVAALGGLWAFNGAAVSPRDQPLARSGLSLRAGIEAAVAPAGWLSLRAQAAADVAVTGRSASVASDGRLAFNRDVVEGQVEALWGPSSAFSIAFRLGVSRVLEAPVRSFVATTIPFEGKLQFALGERVDLSLGAGVLTLGKAEYNHDHYLYFSAGTAVRF